MTLKKLYGLIYSTFFGPFIITFFITLFILVMQFLWVYIDDMVGKGIEWYVIAELLFYASANLVPMALPLAVLLSSIMTFGALGEHYELVAFKAAGISLQRIMLPLTYFMLLLSLGAFYFSNSLWPIANLKFASLLYDVRSKKPAIDIKDNAYYKEIEGYVIRAKDRDKKTDELHDILIYDHLDKRGNTKVIRAEKGKMEFTPDMSTMLFKLSNGELHNDMEGDKLPLYRSTFGEKIIAFDLSSFKMKRTDEDFFKNNSRMMNLAQLESQIDTIKMIYGYRMGEYSSRVRYDYAYIRDSLTAKTLALPDTTFEAAWFENLPKYRKIEYLTRTLNTLRAAKTYIEALNGDAQNRRKMMSGYYEEWHRKFTLSVACIILFFIGAPMGAIIRKGGLGMPVVVSVLFFLLFHITTITGEKMATQEQLPVWLGMWLAPIILTPIGAFLTYKATTDSSVLDADFYKRKLSFLSSGRLFSIFRNKTSNA
jgi:lipopolysaccharide export system permease protein